MMGPGRVIMSYLPYPAKVALLLSLGIVSIVLPVFFTQLPWATNTLGIIILLQTYLSLGAISLSRQRMQHLFNHEKQLDTIELRSNDAELNQVSLFINRIVRQSERRQALLSSCATETLFTAKELEAASESVASGAQQEANSLNALAATSEEVNTTINDISAVLSQSSELSANTLHAALSAQSDLVELSQQVDRTRSHVDDNQAQMTELEQAADAITRFVDIIVDITAQIQLLSLNAAIESARAGEAGRGFAVVANEVRNLATKTESATSDIVALVETINDRVQGAKKQSIGLFDLATESTRRVENVESSLTQIGEAAKAAQQHLAGATQQMQEFQLANNEMCERLQDIAQVSESHSITSRDTQDMVRYLKWLSLKLDDKGE